VFVIAPVVITLVVVVFVVFVGFVVVSITGVIATVCDAPIPHFLIPVVQVDVAPSVFGVEESDHGIYKLAHCVSSLVLVVKLETNTTPC
jgi:hypothetical protein